MRLAPLLFFVSLLSLSGCLSLESEDAQGTGETASLQEARLPSGFDKSYGNNGGVGIGVGGNVVRHEFYMPVNGTLHLVVDWILPEATVEIHLEGPSPYAETRAAQAPGSWESELGLVPGQYTVWARVYGAHVIPSVESIGMRGTFSSE